MRLCKKILLGLLTFGIVLTGFGVNTASAAEESSVFIETQTQETADYVSSSRGYGVLRRTLADQKQIYALIDCDGNYIFDFNSEYAEWGGYTVMEQSVVKIGDSTHSLFYNIKTKKFFDIFKSANECVNNAVTGFTRTELYRCFSGNRTMTATLHCYFILEGEELFYDVDVVFDLTGIVRVVHWGGYEAGDSYEDFWGVGDDAACYYIHRDGAAGTVVIDFITGTQSWISVHNLEWVEGVRRGNACDKVNNFHMWAYSDGYSKVMNDDLGFYGYFDKLGDVVIDFQYEDVDSFHNGYAAVKKNGKWGYIDKTNQVIIPFEYDGAYGGADGYFTVIKNKQCGIVDQNNKVVLPLKYDDISIYEKNVAYALKDGKVVIIRKNENIAKAASTITLKSKTAAYTGKAINIGKATVKGSTGAVTYTYYTDKSCKKKTTKQDSGAAKTGGAPSEVGTYYVKAKVAADADYSAKTSAAVKLTITKATPKITIKTTSKTVKASDLKTTKKAFSIGASAEGNAGLTFAAVSDSNNAKCLSVNKTTGQIGIAKGTKAGTYQVKVKVTAAESANYKAASKTITITVKVK